MIATVQHALRFGITVLTEAGTPSPETDARWLLAAALEMDPGRVILHLNDEITSTALAAFERALTARQTHKPVSQILGRRQFYGRWFDIDETVLDPRPETETLIDLACEAPFARLLDLGTGSGAIAVTLLAERPYATGVGTDISKDALKIAKKNADALGVRGRITLIESDWFSEVSGAYDLIVSNPPYISSADFDSLDPTVRDWEPRIALTPGGDGLDAYRAICARAAAYLRPEGRLIVEIGYDQGAAVTALFHDAGLANIRLHSDMNGKDRVVSGWHR